LQRLSRTILGSPSTRPPVEYRRILYWSVFAVVYLLAGAAGELLMPGPMMVPVVWPAAGLALGALLISGRGQWLPLVAIEWSADLAASLLTGRPMGLGVLFAFSNCLQTLLLAWLLTRYLGQSFGLTRIRQVLWFSILILLVSAFTSLLSALAHNLVEIHPFVDAWFVLTMASTLGTLLVTPIIITFKNRRQPLRPLSRRNMLEFALFIVALLVFLLYAFFGGAGRTGFLVLLPYFTFPFLFWGALRFGPHGAASTVLVLAVLSLGGTLFKLGPFAAQSVEASQAQALVLQVFLGIAALSAYLVAGVISENQTAELALRSSEEHLRAIMTNAPVIITQLDRDGRIIYVNQEKTTPARAPLTTVQFFDQATASSQAALDAAFQEAFISGQAQRVEVSLEELPGESRLFDVRIGPILLGGAVTSVTLIAIDITDRKRAEAALRQSEERYTLAARGANDGIWDWDLTANRVYYSARWKNLLGYKEGGISDSPDEWMGRIHPEDLQHMRQDLETHLSGRSPHFVNEHRVMHRSGSYRWFLVRGIAVASAGSRPHRLAGSMTDITSQKLTEDRLQHDAMHDTLTGLANRYYFSNQLQRSLELARRHPDYQAAVLLVDIDRFKMVNDSLGHALGDQLLTAFGRRLEASMRPEDTVARLGGDEFGILLEEIDSINDATRVAHRIQSNLTAPFDVGGHEVFSNISVGINLVTTNYEKAADMLRDVELAMYQAKAAGRGRYQVFDREMHARSLAQFRMEAELRWALERGEFIVHFQPIYHSTTAEITCLEALLRWEHPERGLLAPGEFIELAEETGLIVPIGEWVLRTVCRQIQAWQASGLASPRVAVNISARQLEDPSFPALVRDVIAETGIPGRLLQLEITESAAMKDFDLTLAALQNLNQMGVMISLDDFGMRYSSLDYLKRFPVNTIKIDKSFVMDIPNNPDDSAITCAIISVGHILNLKVVAEGVENSDQLEFLRQNLCDEIQGHFYSRALTASAITDLLEDLQKLF
jgi:diguanylate cyclase (GGDEF)-like protein/PAS domain S-box-containing protein